MLSKKDKEAIRQIFREEITKAFTRTMMIERGPRKQGDPPKAVREEEWSMVDFLMSYIPRIEASNRGLQEDVDKMKNRQEVIGKAVLGMEESARSVALLSDAIKTYGLKEPNNLKFLESDYVEAEPKECEQLSEKI